MILVSNCGTEKVGDNATMFNHSGHTRTQSIKADVDNAHSDWTMKENSKPCVRALYNKTDIGIETLLRLSAKVDSHCA